MTVGTQKILSTGLKQCLGTGPKRTSVLCLSHPPTVSVTTIYFLLHFFFYFSPPVLYYGFYYLLFDLMHRREFLISVIRLTYSEGGIYLLVCLLAFFPPKFKLSYRLRFSIRHGTTIRNIYLLRGQFFYNKNETKNTKTKRNGSARLASQRTGYHGLVIGSDLLLASSELGWLGLIS